MCIRASCIKSFVKAVKSDGLKMQHPAVGKTYKFGRGSFEILAPKTIEAKGSNNNSVAIKLMNGENSFVFTGDAEHESEAAMCNSSIDLSCDVLVPGLTDLQQRPHGDFSSEDSAGICGDQLRNE